MSNLKRINSSAFTKLTTGNIVEEVSVSSRDGKTVFAFYDNDGNILGEKTVKGEQERFYCREDLVDMLPKEDHNKHGHKGRKQRQRKGGN